MEIEEHRNKELLTQLLNIHIIFCEIASNLPFRDVINCTAVNSLFNCKFREYLHGNRECYIRIRWDNSPCRQLKELNDLLINSTHILPYNGIKCLDNYTTDEWCRKEYHENIDLESFRTILNKVHFTRFVFYTNQKCPANLFMNYVLKFKALELRTISFQRSPWQVYCGIWEYLDIDEETRPTWFANVHTFNFIGEDEIYTPLHIEEILESCPNLRKLTGKFKSFLMAPRPKNLGPHQSYTRIPTNGSTWDWDDLVFRRIPPCIFGLIPRNKYKCITDCYDLGPSQLLELANEHPKLKTLSLLYYKWGELLPEQNYDRWVEERIYDVPKTTLALRILLLSSWDSLEKLICSIRQLLMIQKIIKNTKSVSCLSRLSTLKLTSGTSRKHEAFLYLRCFDFSRILPRLTHVCLNPCSNSEVVDSSVLSNDGGYSHICTTAQSLESVFYIPEEHLQIVASVFTNIGHFEFHSSWKASEMCKGLWSAGWNKLKSVKFCSLKSNFDLDDDFFGLPSVEKEFIESQNLDFETLQYVSSKKSALNFKGLSKIHLEIVLTDDYTDNTTNRSSPLISALTAQRIVKQIPALILEIIIIAKRSSQTELHVPANVLVNQCTTLTQNSDFEYFECDHRRYASYALCREPTLLMYTIGGKSGKKF